MDFALSAEAGLAGLFLAATLAATILPGGSEAVLLAVLHQHPGQWAAALTVATLGNTLGGMSTYVLGRLLPEKVDAGGTAARHIDALRRHGAPLLLLSWVPLIGDVLCATAGWLRLSWRPCLAWMALGKGLRYAVLLAATARL